MTEPTSRRTFLAAAGVAAAGISPAEAADQPFRRTSPADTRPIRIGVLTCENYSHISASWGLYMNPPLEEWKGGYWPRSTGMVMTHVWDPDPAASKAFGERFDVEGHDALAERGLGSAANLTVGQIEDIIATDPRFSPMPPDWKSNSRYRLPLQGAESLIEAGARVAGHIRQRVEHLAAQVSVDTVQVFVGHGAAFRHAAFHLGSLAFDDIRRLSMHHARPVYLLAAQAGMPWQHIAGEWKMRSRGGSPAEGID